MVAVSLHRELLHNGYEHSFASGEIVNGSHKYLTYKHTESGREITFVRRNEYGSDYLEELRLTFNLEYAFNA